MTLVVAFIAITLFSLATCKKKEAKEIRIGIVAPITGEAATFGDLINDIKQTNQNYTVMTFEVHTFHTVHALLPDSMEPVS